jgi:hypothetical protein
MTTKFDEGIKQNLSKHQELMNQLMAKFDVDKTTASKYAYWVIGKKMTLETAEKELTKLRELRTATTPDTQKGTVDLSEATLQDMQAEEDREQAKFEAKMFKKGMRWAVDACIHPEHGGDDSFVTIYFDGEPTDADIKGAIKKNGSCILDDHSAPRELKDPNNKGEKAMMTLIDTSKLTKSQLESPDNRLSDLVTIHNALAGALRKNGHELKDAGPKTFSTKAKAVNRILILVEFAKKDNEGASAGKKTDESIPKPPKSNNPAPKKAEGPTVREIAEQLLLQKDAEGKGLPYSEILKRVLLQFPDAKTSVACLRWYATHMRTDKGLRVPDRPNSVSPQRAAAMAAKRAEGK